MNAHSSRTMILCVASMAASLVACAGSSDQASSQAPQGAAALMRRLRHNLQLAAADERALEKVERAPWSLLLGAAGSPAMAGSAAPAAGGSIAAAMGGSGSPAADGGKGGAGAQAEDPVGPGSWSTGMAMPTIRTELAVAELGGKIYVAGGFGGLDAFEAYAAHGCGCTS